MTREDFCKRCSRYAGCGFISRNLQTKCDILQTFEEGYERGYEDAINKACEWLNENMNDVGIRFMRGDEIKDIVDLFRKAMKGGEE